ncbi:MAG: alpha-E domain-containing protein [Bacteroidota bacterium]
MLSRVANSLYWTGRYIERSEHLARYLKVQYFSTLDAPMSQNKDFVLKSILNMYGMDFDPFEEVDEPSMLLEVGLDAQNSNSLLATVFAARENARSVRYTISTELWEVVNQYYLFIKEYSPEFFKTRGLYDFTVNAAKHCAIVRSYLDHTLVHDDVWVFINLGIHLERAAQIIRILSSKLQDITILSESEQGVNITLRQYQWTITLKVLEAFDMHRRLHKNTLSQASAFDFLITHELFPRSLAYNLRQIQSLLLQLSHRQAEQDPLLFKAGKLASLVIYTEYQDVKSDLPDFLSEILTKIYGLHEAIENEYFQI